jgi:hypothetical protein
MPQSLDYHYVLAIFPIVVLLSRLHDQPRTVAFAMLAVATIAIAAALPYNSPRLSSGLIAILAYPKLYGALLLAGLCVLPVAALRTDEDAVSAPSTAARSGGTSASPA